MLDEYVIDMCKNEYYTRDDYDNRMKLLRKKYKMIPKKTDIIKTYNELLKENKVKSNLSFYKFSMKKMGKSSSGVSVITLMTSPTPKYTNKEGIKVEQKFSCGENCSYCPNEPELEISLEVLSIKENIIVVKTSDKYIKIIRVLSYIKYNNKNYYDIKCRSFKENRFIIEINEDIGLKVGDNIKGIKESQPRSYLSSEPAVLRGNMNDFDIYKQFIDRCLSLKTCGHSIDKLEIIILGGTWDHYPLEYRIEVIRDIYYSANVFLECVKRERESMENEIKYNEKSECRIIGLTIETRPDCINKRSIKRYRNMNITRIQMGVQHIDNDVLDYK
jgi:histone acetyltransferase (RNA polymerase elongator complex component)